MKPIFQFIFFTLSLFNIYISSAQTPGEWTWMSGDSGTQVPVYGIQGIPSVVNHPAGVYEPCEWKDHQGNFWLYGGVNSSSGLMVYGDLWKYEPISNEWTWVNGPGIPNQPAIYGVIGVPSTTNYPGDRAYGVTTWTDLNNDLWLMGGQRASNPYIYCDLWKYNISTNIWTWMSGTNGIPVLGVQGVPSPNNTPGFISECSSSWTDSSGKLWFFGGMVNSQVLDDLWQYNVSTNEWTWMKGNIASNIVAAYGTHGISDSLNTPGSRRAYAHWLDTLGNFWFFGGVDDFNRKYSDLWKYSPSDNNWTWITGPSVTGSSGIYNSLCDLSNNSYPSSRLEQRASWTDKNGDFWMYGGWPDKGDLWKYCVITNRWIWINGNNSYPSIVYGNITVSNSTNHPGYRGGSVGWMDAFDNLWMFGGASPAFFGSADLWRFVPEPLCSYCGVIPIASITTIANHFCSGTCAEFINLSVEASSYQWSFPGASPNSSTEVNPANICYATSGSYDVTLIATNANGSDTLTLQNYITVFPQPPAQSITQSDDTLFAIAGSASYQWFFNGSIISGETNYFYVAQSSGDYNVVVTDTNGCEVEAVINNVIASSQLPVSSSQFVIFPNPVQDKFTIQKLQVTRGTVVELSIYNMMGEKIIDASPLSFGEGLGGEAEWSVNCGSLTSGLYFLEITSDKKVYRTKFVKQ